MPQGATGVGRFLQAPGADRRDWRATVAGDIWSNEAMPMQGADMRSTADCRSREMARFESGPPGRLLLFQPCRRPTGRPVRPTASERCWCLVLTETEPLPGRAGWLAGCRRTLTARPPDRFPPSRSKLGAKGPRSGQRIAQSNLKRPMQRLAPSSQRELSPVHLHVRVRVRVVVRVPVAAHPDTHDPLIRPPRDGARHSPSIHRSLRTLVCRARLS